MTEKTELEFGGATITGGKILLLVPLLGAIGGSMWGGFEVYQRLIDAETAITEYVSPDFSGYDEALAVLESRLTDQSRILDTVEDSLRNETDAMQAQNQRMLANINDQIDTIEVDVRQSESIARTAEDTVADTTRELRDDVYALEERVNDTLRDVDLELREIRDDLESRIQQMLDNPLNDNE
jgi:gas vesicle protein|tara:strand:- start:2535 stop:3080 length:546 start_codon:yes stop_codon:yes gene_type:complete